MGSLIVYAPFVVENIQSEAYFYLEKEIFCHYLKNFVTKLQLKMKTMLLEKKLMFIAKFSLSKNGFSVTGLSFRDRNMDLDKRWLCRS